MNWVLLHADEPSLRSVDDYLGSPMYAVIDEHQFAFGLTLLLLAAVWIVRRVANRGGRRSTALIAPYDELTSIDRFLFWMLLLAGVIHFGLVPGHEPSIWTIGYLAVGTAELLLARSVWQSTLRRRRARLVLLASIIGYTITGLTGVVPDQVGMGTKLIEIAALATLLQPAPVGRMRRLLSTAGLMTLIVLVGLGAWIGAFSGDGGHHLGEVAGPGTLIPQGEDREPTTHEIEEAELLFRATQEATLKYRDPAVAAADGYDVANIVGLDHHAANSAYQSDGRVLDPSRPENLIYAVGPNGPVLVGVMYEAEELGKPGPAVGGPLTVWHGHDHICFSLTPPALAGLTSPYGVCPAGSLTIPITGEMLHVFVLEEAPDRFGHLDEAWLTAYLRGEPLPDSYEASDSK